MANGPDGGNGGVFPRYLLHVAVLCRVSLNARLPAEVTCGAAERCRAAPAVHVSFSVTEDRTWSLRRVGVGEGQGFFQNVWVKFTSNQ